MTWQQRTVNLAPRSRGFHLITHELEQELMQMDKPHIGLLHLFIHIGLLDSRFLFLLLDFGLGASSL